MKDVKSKSGETEKQPREYAPDGPVRLAPNAPDSRGRLNGDGSKSAIVAERPVYVSASCPHSMQDWTIIEGRRICLECGDVDRKR